MFFHLALLCPSVVIEPLVNCLEAYLCVQVTVCVSVWLCVCFGVGVGTRLEGSCRTR